MESVLNHLNSICPTINFTVEDKKLPFLVMRLDDGTITTSVYRKKTHTDRYLSFNSNNPVNVKKGVVRCLLKRAHEVTTDREQLKKELHHVKTALRENDYPAGFLEKCKKACNKRRDEDKDEEDRKEPLATAILPWV